MKIIKYIKTKYKRWLNNDKYSQLSYSKLIDKFPIHGNVSADDIIHISHKLEDGKYETCFITVNQLKRAILNEM